MDLVLDLCQSRMPEQCATKSDIQILYQALFDVNLPKLNAKDEPAFKCMVDDMFGCIDLPAKNVDFLREAFDAKCVARNCQPIDSVYEKVVEVYELSTTRHGLILVGHPVTGKSFVLDVLADALAKKLELDADGIGLYYIFGI